MPKLLASVTRLSRREFSLGLKKLRAMLPRKASALSRVGRNNQCIGLRIGPSIATRENGKLTKASSTIGMMICKWLPLARFILL